MHKELAKDLEENNFIFNICGKKDYQNDIVKLFDNFFENKDNLSRYSNDYLVQDYINYSKNKFDGIDVCISEVLELYRRGKQINPERTFLTFAQFQPITVEISSKYWSMCKLQKDFSTLEDHEYVLECFSLIENVCEIILKKYFALIVQLVRISKNKESDLYELNKVEFGKLFDEIKNVHSIDHVFSIVNNEVRISQWRNIACHKNYHYYDNGQIVCKYGRDLDKTVVVDTKEELLEFACSIYKVSQVITMANKFFLYDNIYAIHDVMEKTSIDIVSFRAEDWQLIFVTELYANGFNVVEIKNTEKLIITVQDTKENEEKERMTLMPIVAYKGWVFTDSKIINVTYVSKEGKPLISVELTAETCEKVAKYEKPISYLAEKMIVQKIKKP